jgi:hypothetical protein
MNVQAKVRIENQISGKITAADLLQAIRQTLALPAGARVAFFVEVDEAGTHHIDADTQLQFSATWDANLTPDRTAELLRWLDGHGPVNDALDRIARGSGRAAVDEGFLRAGDEGKPLAANADRQR